jgi:DNA-binding NarL/FixJ family response regulator
VVAQGLSNRQIADALGISERTARTHVSNILGKLGGRPGPRPPWWRSGRHRASPLGILLPLVKA